MEVCEYVKKVKEKKLQLVDWEGNIFIIFNFGMFGIEQFMVIVNLFDSCIFVVGGISEVLVVKNGQVVLGNVMKVMFFCDYCVVDGVIGVVFL